jgi:hypothetical protein
MVIPDPGLRPILRVNIPLAHYVPDINGFVD